MLLVAVYAVGVIAGAAVLVAVAAALAAVSSVRARRPLRWDPIDLLAVALAGDAAVSSQRRR